MNVDEKYKKDVIWIIWELIIVVAQNKKCQTIIKIIESLLDIFCLKYTASTKRTRKYVLYNCISLLTETCDLTTPIWNDKKQVLHVSQKINVIYKEIKKNEVSPEIPNSDRQHKEKSNLTKTIEKLEMMNKIMND